MSRSSRGERPAPRTGVPVGPAALAWVEDLEAGGHRRPAPSPVEDEGEWREPLPTWMRALLVVEPSGTLAAAMQDVVAEGGVAELPDSDLVELAAAAQRMISWSTSVQVRAVAELARRWEEPGAWEGWVDPRRGGDQGHREAVAEVALASGLSEYATEQRLEAGLFLAERLPATWEALCAGVLEWVKAWEIFTRTRSLTREAAAAVEARVLPIALRYPLPVLRDHLRRAVAEADPEAADAAAKDRAERRGVRFAPGEDGSASMSLYAPATTVSRLEACLDRLTDAAVAAQASDDERDRQAVQADVLSDLIEDAAGALADPERPEDVADAEDRDAAVHPGPGSRGRRAGAPRAQLVVTVPLSTLLGLLDAPADLAGYGPIPAAMAREIAAVAVTGVWDCRWRYAVVDDRPGHEHGTLLGLGRPTHDPGYRPPVRTTDFVQMRDGVCSFPGCRRRARSCDLDHRVPWSSGGDTCACNLQPVCRRHHRLKHGSPVAVEHALDGSVPLTRWRTRTGRAYETEPALLPTARVPVDDCDPPPF